MLLTQYAAGLQGHVDVLDWLLSQDPPCAFVPEKPEKLHLNTLKAMSAWFDAEDCEQVFFEAACHAAGLRMDQEVTKWFASLSPHCALPRSFYVGEWRTGSASCISLDALHLQAVKTCKTNCAFFWEGQQHEAI